MTRIIVTRSEPGGSAFANRLQQLGYDAVSMPLLEAEATFNPAPMNLPQMDGFIITSAHALDFAEIPDDLKSKPLFAVGAATAAQAKQHGWMDVFEGPGDVQQLADTLPDKKLLHLCGEDVVPGTREALNAPYWTVYRTVPTGVHNAALRDIFESDQNTLVTVHSPRAAVFLQTCVQTYQNRMQEGGIIFLCLSQPVLKSLGNNPVNKGMYVGTEPTEDAMVEALSKLL